MNISLVDQRTGELARLTFWLRHIPDGAWLIALYDEADAPAEFVKSLDDMSSLELTFEQVKMLGASPLVSSLPDETRGVLSVSGLIGVGGVAREALDALCDALHNKPPHVLLLWLTLEERDAWLQGESTVWSRSRGYFDLRTAAQADAPDPCPKSPIRFSDRADWEAQVEFVQEALNERRQRAHPLDELGLDLYNRLLNLYVVMGAYQQVEDIAQELLQVSQSQGSKRGLAMAYNDLGLCWHMRGDLQDAIRLYQRALPIYRETGALSSEAVTLLNMGAAYRDLDQRESRRLLEEALSLAQSIGDRSTESVILDHLGGFYHETGDDDQALAYFSQALPIRREVANRCGEANTLSNLGRVYTKREEFQRAQEAYEQALVIYWELGVRRSEALTLNCLGRLFSRQKDEQQAVAYYRQALRIWEELGDQHNQAIVLNNIGVAYHEAANRQVWKAIWSGLTFVIQTTPDSDTSLLDAEEESQAGGEDEKAAVLEAGQQALDAYGAALDIRRDLGSPDDQQDAAKLLMAIAEVYRLMARHAQAQDTYQAIQAPPPTTESRARHAQAQDTYAQALEIWETLGDQVMQVRTWINIGQVHAAQEDQPQALDAYDRALTILDMLGQHPEMPGLLNKLGEAYREQPAPEQAVACYTRSFWIGMEEAALNTHPLYRIMYIDPQRAMALASEALERSRARDQPSDEAWLLNVIGDLHESAKRYAQALVYYNQALARSRKLGERQLEAQALQNLASVHSSMGETERALERYTQSAAIWRDLEALFAEGRVLNHMIVALGNDSERIIPVMERRIEINRAIGMSTTDWERLIEIHRQITSGERVLSDESAR